MKWSLIAMLAVATVLAGLALARGNGTFGAGLKTGGSQLGRIVPILLIAFLISGFVEVLLPAGFVQNWLSDASGWRGIGIAWLAGILTPGGSIIGMPLAAGLFQAGVGISVLVTYLSSLALLSVIRIPIELGFLGPRLTALRVLASLFLPPIAGLLARLAAPWIVGR